MKVEKATNKIEFLKKNPDYEYKWVKAEEDICINNAVVVAGSFYIGRTTSGASTYLGRINIGEHGLKHENEQGLEIMVNSYQVLTCVEKSWVEDTPGGELLECKANLTTLERAIGRVNADLQQCETNFQNNQKLLTETQDKNVLLKDMLEITKDQLKKCLEANPQTTTTQAPATTARPPPTCPSPDVYIRRIEQLERDNATLTRRLAASEANNKRLGTQVTQLERAYGQAQAESEDLQDQVNQIGKRFMALDADLTKCKNSCKGVSGCVQALRDVHSLTQDEHSSLVLQLGRLLPADEKYGDRI